MTSNIEFHLFSERDFSNGQYAGTPYENISVEVRLALQKNDIQTGGSFILWDTLITRRKLSEYPLQSSKIIIPKTFAISENKETLYVSYGVTYTWPYSGPTWFGSYEPVDKTKPLSVVKLEL